VLGNERLTGLAGAVLLALALIEIITAVPLRSLMSVHFFVGVLLAGPVAVKTASTGWRFFRYYTGHPAYRRKGPPRLLQRLLAPLLVASTLAVIGSGIALAATGPAPLILLRIHVISFLVWLLIIIIHVAAYLPSIPTLVADDWHHRTRTRPRPAVPVTGRLARLAVNIAALVAAGIAAVLLLPAAAPWTGWFSQAVTGPGIAAVVAIIAAVVVVTVVRRARRPVRQPSDLHPQR
jgi:membrane protein implicated in regulation of membrane protease activity